jgi:hypothetical protein
MTDGVTDHRGVPVLCGRTGLRALLLRKLGRQQKTGDFFTSRLRCERRN